MSDAAVPMAVPLRPRPRWRFAHFLLLLNIAAVTAVLALWWAATRFGWVGPIFLPSPGNVLHAARITLARSTSRAGVLRPQDQRRSIRRSLSFAAITGAIRMLYSYYIEYNHSAAELFQ